MRLRVKEAYSSDVGRGIARVHDTAFRKLGLESGDVILIKGEKEVPALALRLRPDDREDIIRMDGVLRYNAGTSIDEEVEVEKTKCVDAEEILLSPSEEIVYRPDFVDYVKEQILNIPVVTGNVVVIDVFGTEFLFTVAKTKPKGVVRITRRTRIKISEKPVRIERGEVTYEDIGGLKEEIELIREMVELPMKHPEIFKALGIEPPKGVLLYGPPGTGKTLLAKAVANEANAHFISINGPEIMSKYYGQSEENLRRVFEEAERNAPAIIFIDEIDAIAPKREEVKGEVERRVVAQLLTLMDGLKARGDVIVIAATNRPDDIDPALRRPGRFDREIEIGIPDRNGRKEILMIHTRKMPLDVYYNLEKIKQITGEEFKSVEEAREKISKREDREKIEEMLKEAMMEALADMTHGYTGADLAALAKEAAMNAMRRIMPEIKKLGDAPLSKEFLDKVKVTFGDFLEAMKRVEPSALREVALEIPRVTWEDIGGYEDVKQELRESIEWPLKYRKMFEEVGIEPPKGVLLYGPPGTGKTLLAKAVANEANAHFIAVKGPEVLSKWVGESEKAVRQIFHRARQVAPCVVFFDEIDAIAPPRGSDTSRVTDRIVNQLLTEMDGIQELKDVVVIATTNRVDLVDPALLRPGRLEKVIEVPLPDENARYEIFKVHTRKMKLKGVDLKDLAKRTEGFSGADIEAVCREAGLNAIRRALKEGKESVGYVTKEDFEKALEKIKSKKR